MCARYSLTKEGVTILIGEIEIILAIGARYNIAPKQKVPVIVSERGQPREFEMTWGWQTAYSDHAIAPFRQPSFVTVGNCAAAR